MKAAVLVPSVRPDLLSDFLQSLRKHPQPIDEIHVLAQRYEREQWEGLLAKFSDLPIVFEWRATGGPVYPTRWAHAAKHPDIDVWINADDDIEVLPQTDWATMIECVHSGEYGVISGNFIRSTALMKRSWPPGEKLWVKQPVTNMSGGQAVPKRLVTVLSQPLKDGIGLAPWLFDDIQVGLSAYLMGEQPARYRGSLAIHKILSPKGLSGPTGLFAEHPHRQPDSQWINVKESKPKYLNGNDLYMPVPSDVTKAAHERHESMKKR